MWRYQLVLLLSTPLVLVYLLWTAIRNRDPRFFVQRCGLWFPFQADGGVWLHAVSVGEVNAALPLLEELLTRYPDVSITVSTGTPTGAQMVRKKLSSRVKHAYLPLDWRWAVKHFLARMQPACALVMETELWPNLYSECGRRCVPLLILNGRLSRRTLKAGDWLKQAYTHALRSVSLVLARSQSDADRFADLGVRKERLRVPGNIKLVAAANPAAKNDTAPLVTHPYVLIASSHEDEEFRIARSWLNSDIQSQLLVIAPRHPVRMPAILKQLRELTDAIAVRSRNEPIQEQTRIYLADTLGELETLMRDATLVFMGGSLIPHGGQNILEPARLGKAVLFGPHMHNFADEARSMLEQGAAVEVRNENELIAEISELISNETAREKLGRNARRLIDAQKDILHHYLKIVEQECPCFRD